MREHISHPQILKRKINGVYTTESEHIGFNGKVAVYITKKFGSMGMFYFLVLWMILWMSLATFGFPYFKNDPYPFTFLLFLSNLVQLWALPVLAVGQQVLSRASDRQAKQTYEDAEALLQIQDELHRLVKINNEMTKKVLEIMEYVDKKNE